MNRPQKLSIAVALCLTGVTGAHAQATRTWVSGVGDDANPCSRTAPCKTFAGAISKTSAGGEIDALDPAGYGALTITKAITIDAGAGQVGSVLVSGTNGITIAAGTGDTVTLRNLSFNGLGTGLSGVSIITAKAVHLENLAIFGFTQSGVNVAANSALTLTLNRVISRDNTVSGITIQGASGTPTLANILDSVFQNNGTGLVAYANSKVTVRESVANGNGGAGFQANATGGAATLNLVHSSASENTGAGIQAGGDGTSVAVVRISDVSVFSNGSGLLTSTGGNIFSFGDNQITGGGVPTGTIAKQ